MSTIHTPLFTAFSQIDLNVLQVFQNSNLFEYRHLNHKNFPHFPQQKLWLFGDFVPFSSTLPASVNLFKD